MLKKFESNKRSDTMTPEMRKQRRISKIQDRRSIMEPETGLEIEDDY
ncbi:MAG: hypothetical protein JW891_15900 [Candidatus Lokiarchaeota archaeon]|nr:hypothetical protein [Candidatus Lokiarchaeota archaeon]